MITLSNGHKFEYMVASGALAFDGKGWFWERPLVALGIIRPELFTVVARTITREPRLYPKSNLSWIRPWTWLPWSPWSCVRPIPDNGFVNKVGLYNPGHEWWCDKVGPTLDSSDIPLVGSIYGDERELVEMTKDLNRFDLVGLEVNSSCPNTGHAMSQAEKIMSDVKAVAIVSRKPVIVKVSVDQDYIAIARGLKGVAEAISLNSVPWKRAFPNGEISPLRKLEERVGGGGGGVSGKPAQHLNWLAVRRLAMDGSLSVIGPSVMEFRDVGWVRELGAQAVSFGAIHLRTPWKPTSIVKRDMAARGQAVLIKRKEVCEGQ